MESNITELGRFLNFMDELIVLAQKYDHARIVLTRMSTNELFQNPFDLSLVDDLDDNSSANIGTNNEYPNEIKK